MAYSKDGSGSFFVAPMPEGRFRLPWRRSKAGQRPREIYKQRNREWLHWAWPRALAISLLVFGPIAALDLLLLHNNSFVLGFTAGAGCALFMGALQLQVPQRVENWRIGAMAERRTGNCLRALEAEGWTVYHGIEAGKSDRDHVVLGPTGLFLLDTKDRNGRMTVEDGSLITRYRFSGDDAERRDLLSRRCKAYAAELAAEVAGRASRTKYQPWVHPVVVLWGDFPAGEITSDGVTFIHGKRLAGWLREHRGPAVPEWLQSEVAQSLAEIAETGIPRSRRTTALAA